MFGKSFFSQVGIKMWFSGWGVQNSTWSPGKATKHTGRKKERYKCDVCIRHFLFTPLKSCRIIARYQKRGA